MPALYALSLFFFLIFQTPQGPGFKKYTQCWGLCLVYHSCLFLWPLLQLVCSPRADLMPLLWCGSWRDSSGWIQVKVVGNGSVVSFKVKRQTLSEPTDVYCEAQGPVRWGTNQCNTHTFTSGRGGWKHDRCVPVTDRKGLLKREPATPLQKFAIDQEHSLS